MPRVKPEGAGDTWTWTALDADSKLIISWYVGPRDLGSAYTFMMDLAERLHGRVQLTTDGLNSYLSAVEDAFGADVDYSQLVKLYGSEPEGEKRYSPAKCIGTIQKPVTGDPDPKRISTSYVERQNLTMRMSMRRFTRLTNAFSKRLANRFAMLSIYFVWYNFCRIHKTLRVTTAMQAGLSDTVRDVDWYRRDGGSARSETQLARPVQEASGFNWRHTEGSENVSPTRNIKDVMLR